MTTNGILLAPAADSLRKAGLARLNISLDSLREDRFERITRGGRLADVLKGIEAAREAGFPPPRINVVIMREVNDDEILDLLRFAREKTLNIRFIEYMSFGSDAFAESDKFVSAREIREILERETDLVVAHDSVGAGPAVEYRIPGSDGRIGLISAVSHGFCRTCNRLRLTANGRLRACLVAGREVDVKSLIRSGGSDDDIAAVFQRAADMKPAEHVGAGTAAMRRIGG